MTRGGSAPRSGSCCAATLRSYAAGLPWRSALCCCRPIADTRFARNEPFTAVELTQALIQEALWAHQSRGFLAQDAMSAAIYVACSPDVKGVNR